MKDMEKMDKYKIIALFGKSGAGKDFIQKWMISNLPNMNGIISYTTRPPREGEVDGKDYHFVAPTQFAQDVLDGNMLEATEFNDWFYGTPISSLDKNKINVGVFNITGIECLLQDFRLDVLPVLIEASDYIRLQRCLNREDHPDCKEICRRFLTDEKDFENIDFEYVTYLNVDDDKEYFNIHKIPTVKEFINGQN